MCYSDVKGKISQEDKNMHSFHGESCTILHNSDMSGDITIINKETNEEISIKGQDILNFVGGYINDKMISKLEDIDIEEMLRS